jgi:DNA-binding beta-propeller fold protein YncE
MPASAVLIRVITWPKLRWPREQFCGAGLSLHLVVWACPTNECGGVCVPRLLLRILVLFFTLVLGCATPEEQPISDRVPSTVPSPRAVDAAVLPGYRAEVVVSLLNYPTSIAFDPSGNLYVAEGGSAPGDQTRPPRILRIAPAGQIDIMTDKVQTPVRELQWRDGRLFIWHGQVVSTVNDKGELRDVPSGSAPKISAGDLRITSQTAAFGRPGQILRIVPPARDRGGQVLRIDRKSRKDAIFFCARAGEEEQAALDAGAGPRCPVDLEFSTDGRALYVADFGVSLTTRAGVRSFPETGVIWRIVKDGTIVSSPPANLAPPPQIERRPLTLGYAH